MRTWQRCVVVTTLALGLAVWGGVVSAQKSKGKTRAATTKQLMKGVVFAHCSALGQALKAEETDWEDIALRAAVLNEAGYLLMDDGRCPDGEWAKAAKALQAASAEVLSGAEKQDKEATQAAFKKLTTESCAVCHKAHKQ